MSDALLWRLLHQSVAGTRLYDLAKLAPLVLLGGSALVWALLERRWRSAWRSIPGGRARLGTGPYRASSLPTGLERAPATVRATSLLGFGLGAVGLLWPLALLAELVLSARSITAPSLAVEALGSLVAATSLASAVALLRPRDRVAFWRRARLPWTVLAAALAVASLVYVLGGLDAVVVEVSGIKWREPMTLAAFLRTGFAGFWAGHSGVGWRVLLFASASFGMIHAAYLAAWITTSSRSPSSPSAT